MPEPPATCREKQWTTPSQATLVPSPLPSARAPWLASERPCQGAAPRCTTTPARCAARRPTSVLVCKRPPQQLGGQVAPQEGRLHHALHAWRPAQLLRNRQHGHAAGGGQRGGGSTDSVWRPRVVSGTAGQPRGGLAEPQGTAKTSQARHEMHREPRAGQQERLPVGNGQHGQQGKVVRRLSRRIAHWQGAALRHADGLMRTAAQVIRETHSSRRPAVIGSKEPSPLDTAALSLLHLRHMRSMLHSSSARAVGSTTRA